MNSIVYITNEQYLYQTYISMFSLKYNKKQNISYKVYLLCIEFNNIGDINKLNSDDFQINPIYIKKNIYRREDNEGTVYYKLILQNLIDEDIIFHIDSDTIVVKDISAVFDYQPQYIGAVKDKLYIGYFNAGNILMNLKNIRSLDDIYIKYFEQDKILPSILPRYLWEQDILNTVYKNNITPIHYGYNLLVNHYTAHSYKQLGRVYGETLQSDKIKIIHYASHPKPWQKMTPWGKIWEMYTHDDINTNLIDKYLKVLCYEKS